jgi:hypothetical protein
MKKYIYGFLSLFLMATVAVAGNYGRLTSITGAQDPSQLSAVVNGVINNYNATSPGLLYINGTSTTNSGTSEATLFTYTLPGGYLANNGQSIRVKCYVGTAATADNKTLLLYFGASSITTAAAANNAGGGWLEYTVTRTGAATQSLSGSGQFGAAGVTPIITQHAAATATLSGDVEIRCRALDAVSGGSIGRLFIVESLR